MPLTSVLAGATSGAVGGTSSTITSAASHSNVPAAVLGNPLFLIKARMQAYSPALPVGHQHFYKHSWDALSTIFKKEGIRGLTRGVDAAVLRTAMGSSVSLPTKFATEDADAPQVQLPTYNWTKNQLTKRGILPADSVAAFLASSSVSGLCVVRIYKLPGTSANLSFE